MADWFDYTLSDLLLFSSETYWRLFEQVNLVVWPYQLVVLPALIGLAVACMSGWLRNGLIVGVSLASCWAFVGIVFLEKYYSEINWAIYYVMPLVWVQIVLLLLFSPRLDYSTFGHTPVLALVVVLFALIYPVLGLLDGRPFTQVEVVGIAPDPTAFFNVALMALAKPDWRRTVLSFLPSIWLATSVATIITLESSNAAAAAMIAVMATMMLALTRIGNRWVLFPKPDRV